MSNGLSEDLYGLSEDLHGLSEDLYALSEDLYGLTEDLFCTILQYFQKNIIEIGGVRRCSEKTEVSPTCVPL